METAYGRFIQYFRKRWAERIMAIGLHQKDERKIEKTDEDQQTKELVGKILVNQVQQFEERTQKNVQSIQEKKRI